jgi:hypothetical protein
MHVIRIIISHINNMAYLFAAVASYFAIDAIGTALNNAGKSINESMGNITNYFSNKEREQKRVALQAKIKASREHREQIRAKYGLDKKKDDNKTDVACWSPWS